MQTDELVLSLPGLSPASGDTTQQAQAALAALGRLQIALDATAAELAALGSKPSLVRLEVQQLAVAALDARARMASGPLGHLSAAAVEERRATIAEIKQSGSNTCWARQASTSLRGHKIG